MHAIARLAECGYPYENTRYLSQKKREISKPSTLQNREDGFLYALVAEAEDATG